MNYFLTIQHADGRADHVLEIDTSISIPIESAGNLILVDENGKSASASLSGRGEDLVVALQDGILVTLEGFYAPDAPEMTLEVATYAPDGKDSDNAEMALVADPEAAEMREEVEGGEGESDYQFNGTLGGGALGFGSGFTLMRFSNTEYIGFGEPVREVEATEGFYRGTPPVDSEIQESGETAIPMAGRAPAEPVRFIPVGTPIEAPTPSTVPDPYRPWTAVDDTESIDAGNSITMSLLGNDTRGSRSGALMRIEGNSVSPGDSVTLSNGAIVKVGNGGEVTYNPNGVFVALTDGESATDSFEYTISDGLNESTATVTVDIAGENDGPDAVDDHQTLNENGMVTFDPTVNDSDPDSGDSVSLVSVSSPDRGTIATDPGGMVTYDPGKDFDHLSVGESATETVTYVIEDNQGATDTATVTFTINGQNDAPLAVDDFTATPEETRVNINLLENDTDPDQSDRPYVSQINGQPASKGSEITLGGGATATLKSDGTVDYQPASNTNALDEGESLIDTFTYTINDGNGSTATATATVTIHGQDDPMRAVDDQAATQQASGIAIDVLANDSDPDTSDTLRVVSVADPSRGSTSINLDGTVQFEPGSDFTSLPIGETTVESFTYTVATPDGDTETATVNVTITGENDGPTAVADTASTLEVSTVNVNLVENDTDPDTGDDLSVHEVAGISATPGLSIPLPSGASVILLGNDTVNYTAAPSTKSLDAGETSIDTFDYIVRDETGATSTSTVTITVNGVDDPIVAVNDSGSTPEGAPVVINVLSNDSDPDSSDTLTVTGVTTPPNGSIAFDPNGDITFDPDGDFETLGVGESATESVTYTVTTPDGDTASATLTVTITGTNDGPIATNELAVTNEEVIVNIDVLANETDVDVNDTVTLASIEGQQPTNPIVLTSGATVTVLANGTVNYQPAPSTNKLDAGESVVDSFDYVVKDGSGATATATTTITINGLDDPIVAVNDAGSGAVGTPIVIDVLANDSDPDTSDTLSVSEVEQPTKGSVTINPDNTVSFDPGTDFVSLPEGETATETFTYTVETPDGDTETATVTVTVTGANDGPTAIADHAVTNEQITVNIDVIDNDTDPDSDTLKVAAIEGQGTGAPVTLPSGAVVTLKIDGTLDYAPAASTNALDAGETLIDSFSYTAIDPSGATSTTTATVTIHGADDPIVTANDFGTTDEGAPITVDVVANDRDPDTSDTLEVIGVSTPIRGTATVTPAGTVTFDPDGDFEGLGVGESATETVTYTVRTPDGDTETATLTITVTGLNDGPAAADEAAVTNEQVTVNIDILDNDTDPDTNDTLSVKSIEGQLTTSPVTLPSGATATLLADGSINYKPATGTESLDEGETLIDTFDYVVVDEQGATATATTTITIKGLDDPISAADDTGATNESSVVNIDVLTNDRDPDTSDTLAVTGVTQPDKGKTSINPDGSIEFDPNGEFEALGVGESTTESVIYTVSTPDGDTATATLTVTVTGQNDGPDAVDESASTNEQTLVNLDILANDTDPDSNDTLSIQSIEGNLPGTPVALASGATVTVKADGTVNYQPANSTESLDDGETLIDTFDYVVTDSNGGTATATATVTINGVDDPIVAVDDTGMGSDSSLVTIHVLANDSDPDDTDTLSVQSITQPRNGTATLNSDGTVTFDPDGDFSALSEGVTAIETFTYTVANSDGATETANVTVTITGGNDGPTAVADDATTPEQTLVNLDIVANDTDPDTHDELTIQSIEGSLPGSPITLASGATVTVKANGTVDYQPAASTDTLDAGETLIDTFDYVVTDSNGGSATATATVTINGIDDPIVANDDADVTGESTAVTTNVLVNDSDPDTSDLLSVTGVSTPSKGSATVNGDNTITFDPNGGFEALAVGETAIETLTYSVINTDGATESASLKITITGENDGPEAFDESTTTQEQTLVNMDIVSNDTDLDGDTLSVESIEGSTGTTVTLPSGATVTRLANGTIDYQPSVTTNTLDSGETAIDSFDYVVEDGNGGSATATATITITGVDDPSSAIDDVGTTDQSTAINIDVLANDSDPDLTDVLRVTGVTQPDKGLTTVNSDGTVNFDPNGAFESLGLGESTIETFDYTVMTPDGDTATASVTVTVTGENDGPTAEDDAISTNEQTLVNLDLLENDTDPDTNDTLSIQSIEGSVPTAPIVLASGATVTAKADGTVDYQPAATTDSLDAGESLIDTFDYVVVDTGGATSTATATVTILGIDDPIVAMDDANTTTEDDTVTTQVLANDSDADGSDTLTVISVTPPGNGSVTINGDGSIEFDPSGDFEGLAVGESATETVVYTVKTPDGDTETASLTITVTGVNDGPTANDESASTDEQVSVNVDILTNDTDLDLSDSLSIQSIDGELPTNLITLASGATITVRADQTIDYQPAISTGTLDAGETLIDTFDYVIEDGSGASATATTTITINGVDDPTTARSDFDTTDESTAINVNVLSNDSDPDTSDTLSVTGVTQPDRGTTTVNPDGTIHFDPNGDFEGLGQGESAIETVTYTVSTPDGDTATATLTVTINGQNDGPVATGETTSTLEETKVNLNILANDTDADTNDDISIQSIENQTIGAPITLASGAKVTVLADGTVDYQPASTTGALDEGESVIDTFDYVITDGNGGTSSATATVTINGVDDPIVAVDDQAGTNPNDSVVIDVLANDSDPDSSDALSISSITQPANGSASIVGSQVVFDPDGDFDSLPVGATAVETFTYVVGTPDGDSETATVFVTITGGNDGPTAVADSATTDEQVLVNVDLLANDTDPDTGDTLTIQWIDGKSAGSPVTLASGATVTLKPDGTIDYQPAADTESLDEGETRIETFDYVVADQSGVTSTATATITINGVDDPLTANDESNVATESVGVTTNVLANDSDPDATDRPLKVQSIVQPENGVATLNVDGTISFDPGGEFETLAVGDTQIETIDYVVVNQDGATENATLTITVTGLNDGPTAVDESASTNEQSLVNVDILVNDSDLDSDTVAIQSIEGQGIGLPITLGSGATVTVLPNGTVDYQAASTTESLDAGETAIDSFDYVIEDGNGGSATATTTITINGVDDPISAIDDNETTSQSSPINVDVLANDSDPDTSDTLAVTGVTVPDNGSVSVLPNGTIQFDPNGDFDFLGVGESATETMTYTVETPDGDTATATLTITITGQNDGPIAVDDAVTTSEETLVNLDVLDNDSDVDTNDTLSILSIEGQPTGSAIPLASGATVTVLSNGTVDYQPAVSTGSLDDGETLIDTFNYVVSDGEGGSATATARITINGVDDPLVALDDHAGTNPTTTIQIDVLANDSDPDASDTLGLLSVTQPTNGTVAISGGQITFDPDGKFDALPDGETAVETFDYVVGTPDGDTETATVNVTITGGNDAPTAVADFATTDEQVVVNMDLLSNDTDPDTGDNLSIATIQGSTNSTVTLASGATVTLKPDGTVDYQPAASTESLDSGETFIDTFTYTVTDAAGATATATATVTIDGVDDALIANDESNTTTEEASVTTNVLANDSDPDTSDRPLAIQSITQPSNGAATLNVDGTITFDPDGEFETLGVGQFQIESIDYVVVNQDGETENATLTITVGGVNDGPTALDESTSTFEETVVNIDILDNDTDIDGDAVVLHSIEGSSSGTVTLSSGAVVTIKSDGTVDYQPDTSTGSLDAGETLIDSFDYVIKDPSGSTSSATATVTINGVDDPMALQDDERTTDEGNAVNVDVLSNDSDSDTSDVLSVIGVTIPGKGNVSVNSDGTIRFDPNGDFESLADGQSATETVTYTVETPDGDTATATLTVTINGVNDDPNAVDDSRTINELQTVNVDLLANDTDQDNGDTLTLTQLNGQSASSGPILLASGATLTLKADGTVDYQAAPSTAALNTGESATDTFTYIVTDSEGATDTATATITINGVTTLPPDAVNDAATTTENAAVNLDILANDSEPDLGDSFSLQTIEGTSPVIGNAILLSSGATVTLKNDGTIDYQPAAGTNALDAGESVTDSFSYTIVDTQGNTDTATANITVHGVDDAIIAQDDSDSTTEHATTSFNVLSNDSDPDSADNPLTLSDVTDPGRGSVSFNANGEVSFDPGTDFEYLDDGETAIESVTYTVVNQDGDSTTATHTITIHGEDDALVANDEATIISEDSLTTVSVLDNDFDPDDTDNSLTVQSIIQPASGTATLNGNGTITYNPNGTLNSLAVGETSIQTVNYIVENNDGATESATLTITVTGLNDGPVANDESTSTLEQTTVTIDIVGNDTDVDGDSLSIQSIENSGVLSSGATVTIRPDGQVDYQPAASTGSLDAGETLIDTFDYVVEDGHGGSAIATATITINGVDDPISVNPDQGTTNESSDIDVTVLANDSDPDTSDTLVVIGVTQPGSGTTSVNGDGSINFDPDGKFESLGVGESATETVTYTVETPDGDTATSTLTVTINGVNDGPTANNEAVTTFEQTTINLDILANDSDPDANDTLTIQSLENGGTLASGATVSVLPNGTVNYTPAASTGSLDDGESLVDTFDYVVVDGSGGTATATATVTIQGVDDPIRAVADTDSTNEEAPTTFNVLANDSDPDATDDPLILTNVTDPTKGEVTFDSAGDVTFDPNGEFDYLDGGETAIETVTYTVQNQDGDTAAATHSITITGIDDPLVANDESTVTTEAAAITTTVLANDSDPDATDNALAVQSITQPASGVATLNGNGTVTYDPNGTLESLAVGETSIQSIDYVVVNQDGATENATLTITVTGMNDHPVANDEATTTQEQTTVTIDIVGNDTDVDGDPLSIQSLESGGALASGATVTVRPDGQIDYQPAASTGSLDAGETLIDSFDYVVTDSKGGSATATATITINGVDDPISANPDTGVTNESTDIDVNVLGNDSDPDTSDILVVIGVTQPDNGTTSVNGDGTINFDPNGEFDYLDAGESATETVTYTVQTPDGDTATSTLTVTINGQDDPLVALDDADSTMENASTSFNVLTNDSDADASDEPLTLTHVAQPENGSISFNASGSVTFNPGSAFNYLDAGETAIETVTYTVQNQDGVTETATHTITIFGEDDALEAQNDATSTFENQNVSHNVLTNDSDPDTTDNPLTLTAVTQPSNGSVTFNSSGNITFNPGTEFDDLAQGETAIETVTYTVQNQDGITETATHSITINGVNDAPTTAPDSLTISPQLVTEVTGGGWGDNNATAGSTTVTYSGSSLAQSGGNETLNNIAAFSDSSVQNSSSLEVWFDENGTGGSGTITFTFSQAVKDPILHIDRIGGTTPSGSNSAQLTLTTPGASLTRLSGVGHFNVDETNNRIYRTTGANSSGSESSTSNTAGTAAGSVQVNGTVTSVTFSVVMIGAVGVGDELEFKWGIQEAFYEAETVNVLANDSDPEGDTMTLIGVTSPTNGSVSFSSNGNITFDPGNDFDGLNDGQSMTETLTYTVQDANGATSTDTVTFTVEGSSHAAQVAPVVIDLDGDGAEFVGIEDGILMDVDGDGEAERTAWAGNDDAVLVYDKNENDDVDGSEEFAFAQYVDGAETDLEGLAHFDTDGSGTLAEGDDEFSKFKLWQDKDGDGIVGEGELTSLADAGIESLDLLSDGISYQAADGDVYVHGSAQVNYADGSTGEAADASFDYREVDQTEIVQAEGDEAPLEVQSSATSTGVEVNLDEPLAPSDVPVEGGTASTGGDESFLPPPVAVPATPDEDAAAAAASHGA